MAFMLNVSHRHSVDILNLLDEVMAHRFYETHLFFKTLIQQSFFFFGKLLL